VKNVDVINKAALNQINIALVLDVSVVAGKKRIVPMTDHVLTLMMIL
jgi:hypothetical protein